MKSPILEVSASRYILIFSLLNLALYHIPLYGYATKHLTIPSMSAVLTFSTLLMVVFLASVLFLSLIGLVVSPLLKPVCFLLLLLNGIATYFMVKYGIIFDREMMGNIFNTRLEESTELFHPKLLAYFFFLGVIPAWLIAKIKIISTSRLSISMQFLVIFGISTAYIYSNSSTWLWFDEHSKQLGGAILPWSYLINTGRSFAYEGRGEKEVVLLPAASMSDSDKLLVVLIIGETARSENFSLYGYDRDTNPKLSQSGATALADAKSCSTYTTASLHCMLSHTGSTSGDFETLPDYLQRSGVDVIWRTNNWGEPPLSVGTYESAHELRKSCIGSYCEFDDALLTDLESTIENTGKEKVFLVLHTKGSHGPSYHERYPDDFEIFKPVCRSVELDKCSEQSLINAYDNTILYTDDFLSRTIELVKSLDDMPAVVMYISDHGESLGEYGLYLHGTPYAIAPDVQKDIPFVIWMSDKFQEKHKISPAELNLADDYNAHNRIFHSVLGAFGMQSEVYKRALDLFSSDDTGPR